MGAVVVVGGPEPDPALTAFKDAGFELARGEVDAAADGSDLMVWLDVPAAGALAEADRRGVGYVLVHYGPDTGEPEGTYARAHHRVSVEELPALARRLRSRERLLVSVLAFGYKNGLPGDADWVVDCRMLENPYWVPELKELTGEDQAVVDYVLRQPEAGRLLDSLESILRDSIPLYAKRGRSQLTVAFGCTGGQHRSVVMARELSRRLGRLEGIDVELRRREA